MTKKDDLEQMFSNSIVNDELIIKVKGGQDAIVTSSRGARTSGIGEGGYTTYDSGEVNSDDWLTDY